MPHIENHEVGVDKTTLPTADYETLISAAKSHLQVVERLLDADAKALRGFTGREALEKSRDNIKTALGIHS